jgi:hypothetical protein
MSITQNERDENGLVEVRVKVNDPAKLLQLLVDAVNVGTLEADLWIPEAEVEAAQ